MKTKNQIEINGVKYPCRKTMGAFVRFRNMFDKETHEADMANCVELCGYVFCLVQSACNADKVDFPYEFTDFCDALTDTEFAEIAKSIFNDEDKKTEDPKKAKSR